MNRDTSAYAFDPEEHAAELEPILDAIERAPRFGERDLQNLLRRHPKDGRAFFSKSELIRGYRALRPGSAAERAFIERVRMKPVRTRSGVAPVTVLTRPFPCPGRCIFCPSDVRMPKSYLSSEPGAQRAAEHQFDPFRQTLARLRSYHHTGHPTDKIELIVLGGTWSSYPEAYRIWFILRCFQAMNRFSATTGPAMRGQLAHFEPEVDFRELDETVEGALAALPEAADGDPDAHRRNYNRIVSDWTSAHPRAADQARRQTASWADLERAQRSNETAAVRCVGLSLETRPDRLDRGETLRMRRLGATKVQIGVQSTDDDVLALNRRGHDTARTRRAIRLLRGAGFKIQAHWMPNLHGSTPDKDREDFDRLFRDPDLRPDELKIYPCSLIESAELMAFYRRGAWRPYTRCELLDVLVHSLGAAPRYCRLTRVIRDIPGTDIVTGNRTTNMRQVAEAEARDRGVACRDIRAREIGGRRVDPGRLRVRRTDYDAASGRETFLEFVNREDRIAGFLRLRLPGPIESAEPCLAELAGRAIIREVHVYGAVVGFGERGAGRSQHVGLGRSLIVQALEIARAEGFERMAVISSVGTREYYRGLGFVDGALYQHRPTAPALGEVSP